MASSLEVQVPSINSYSAILNYSIPKLHKIIDECLDVSFSLCNNELTEFGFAKIFDVFNQLITTGFVLNTGYWCFFSTFKGQCLCVCGRYGTYCRHIRNPHHWIDMEPIDAKENDYTFYPKYFGSICPTDYNVAIEPINEYQPGYHIIINLTVEYKKLGRGRPRRTDKDKPTTFDPRNAKQKFETAIYARYNLTSGYYPSMVCNLVFQPNPTFHEYYGAYFKKLLDDRGFNQFSPSHFSVPIHNYNASIVLFSVNVPQYEPAKLVYALIPPSEDYKHKLCKTRRPKPEALFATPLEIKELPAPIPQCPNENQQPSWNYYSNFNQFASSDVQTSLQSLSIKEPKQNFKLQLSSYEYQATLTKPSTSHLEDMKPMLETLKLQYNNSGNYPITPLTPSEGKFKFPLPATITSGALESSSSNNSEQETSSNDTPLDAEPNSSSPVVTTCIDPRSYSEVVKTPDNKTLALISEFNALYPDIGKPKPVKRTKEQTDRDLSLLNEVLLEDLLTDQLKPDYLKKYINKDK